ncbi:MAG: ASKHA domain-containing protein, partial [Rhodospirillales bacterium]|nr:ASKHA domain-containing protein [Rhodospirillales bacterium]
RRYAQVGNAAGEGARLALLSNSERDEARILGLKCRYLELADTPDFQRVYVGRINFDPALLPP